MASRRAFLKLTGSAAMFSSMMGKSLDSSTLFGVPSSAAAPYQPHRDLGFKPHFLRQGDGKGGWVLRPAEIQFLDYGDGMKAYFQVAGMGIKPFGLAQMDNGEVALIGSWDDGKVEWPVITFSQDGARTWTEFARIGIRAGRPMLLTYLGKGELMFQLEPLEGEDIVQYFSHDYGRLWPEQRPLQLATDGKAFHVEGNPLVDRGANGIATWIAAIGYNYPDSTKWPVDPALGMIRWSKDGGRTWVKETAPKEWQWQETYEGKTYTRGISEGSLVRARNGWLAAGLRTDMNPSWFAKPIDNYEGIGVSISKDNGETWSPIQRLYESGRMHMYLQLLPDGDIVMTHIERQDIEHGKLASYRRGCGAVVSHDNGLTWDMAHRHILDGFDFSDGTPFALACGHLYSTLLQDGYMLTAYGNYPAKGAVLIRWKLS